MMQKPSSVCDTPIGQFTWLRNAMRRMAARPGRKLGAFFILILFLIPFQLRDVAVAGDYPRAAGHSASRPAAMPLDPLAPIHSPNPGLENPARHPETTETAGAPDTGNAPEAAPETAKETTEDARAENPPRQRQADTPVAPPPVVVQSDPAPAMGDAADVLNEILGTDAVQPDSKTAPAQQATPAPAAREAQKPFSFLDADAQSVLAPEFDYGVYSMNMRVLDGYRTKIQDALETSRQLSLDIPEQRVQALMLEANKHKRRFESLYLNNQTTEGLAEMAQAKRLMLQALALTSSSPKVEGRAIWLDRGTIVDAKNPAGLKKVMQRLHRAGINIVYFETLNAGFPIYPSKILRSNPLVDGWDPLQTAIEEGHRLGMEVHAWVWAFAVGNRRHNPLIGKPSDYAGPVLEDGGMMPEALRNQSGGLSVDGRQHEFWLSPASPKARQFLLDIYKEIVTRYDVDGVQLDYIRYPFQSSRTRMGYEPVGRERFAQSTGMSLDTLDDYTARLWIAWKTYQVSSFVQQVSETLKRIRPELKLSAAVFPMKREARIVAIQQDWETWVDNGWIDTLSPMSYTSDPERLQALFETVQASPNKHMLVYPGIALHRLDGGQLVLHLEALREKGSLGVTLFAGAHLNDEKIEALGDGPFKRQDSLPPHRDVVKSLKTILADYDEKFVKLQREGALVNLPATEAQNIQTAVAGLRGVLEAIGPVPMPQQLHHARQQLGNLQTATDGWTAADRGAHPFRVQYFEKKLLLLSELMGYLGDKMTGTAAITGFTPSATGPGKQAKASPTQAAAIEPEADEADTDALTR